MRPTPSIDAHHNPSGFLNWNSPLPYMFGGLGMMVLLIAAALVILACSYRKYSSSRSADQGGEKPTQLPATVSAADNTPKIVVIMAGDNNPTQLALPVPSSFMSAKQLPA